MEWLKTLFVVLQVVSALAIIGLVLIQQGKGADMGAAFGSGSSGSVFGATGSANFLSRTTAVFAVIFLSVPLVLPGWVVKSLLSQGFYQIPLCRLWRQLSKAHNPFQPPQRRAIQSQQSQLYQSNSGSLKRVQCSRIEGCCRAFPRCRRGEIGRHAILRG